MSFVIITSSVPIGSVRIGFGSVYQNRKSTEPKRNRPKPNKTEPKSNRTEKNRTNRKPNFKNFVAIKIEKTKTSITILA